MLGKQIRGFIASQKKLQRQPALIQPFSENETIKKIALQYRVIRKSYTASVNKPSFSAQTAAIPPSQ